MSLERQWFNVGAGLIVISISLLFVQAYIGDWLEFSGYAWAPNAIKVASILICSIGLMMLGNYWSGNNERKPED